MRRVLLLGVLIAAAVGAAPADAAVIKTNWVENLAYSGGKGTLRLYVRRIEVTRTTWKAAVGFTNRSSIRVRVLAEQTRQQPSFPFTYWAGPGIWWSTYISGATWWPGAGASVTHSTKATRVAPTYPEILAPGKSWFGVFTGSTAKLPKDRLLRIGFGVFDPADPRDRGNSIGTGQDHRFPVSTSHQFRMPRVR